ncbi:MAG: RNA polymerase sigma factor RpoE [Oceanospirillales bacterium LUC14_002_19_P2]|nr:MAG: RNA polymerase sigma factor RpoE [Oceanospirillales bacterium LUC14_002_19_P2]
MADAQETDQQLVSRVQKGDKRAFDLLVIKYQHKILGLVGSYVHDFQEVQDVTQEAFIKAYRALGQFRGDSAFYTWLYRIAINTAKNFLVARGRRPPDTDVDVYNTETLDSSYPLKDLETPEHNVQKDEIEAVIFKVIKGLPDELRTAVTLREFDGLSYEDIAEIMDCPVGTVRSRIFRAREAIDKVIQPLLSKSG